MSSFQVSNVNKDQSLGKKLAHLGLAKTGTTFLQNGLMAELEKSRKITLIGPKRFEFGPGQSPGRRFSKRINLSGSNNDVVLVSNEKLLSVYPSKWKSDADLLGQLLQGFTPILVLRETNDWIRSISQQIVKYRPIPDTGFIKTEFIKDEFSYEKLVEHMVQNFPKVILVRHSDDNLEKSFRVILGHSTSRTKQNTRRTNISLSLKAVMSKLTLNKFFIKIWGQDRLSLPSSHLFDYPKGQMLAELFRRIPAYLFLFSSELLILFIRRYGGIRFSLTNDQQSALKEKITSNNEFLESIFGDGSDVVIVEKRPIS